MCAFYQFEYEREEEIAEIRKIMNEINERIKSNLAKNPDSDPAEYHVRTGVIYPKYIAPVIIDGKEGISAGPMRWGLPIYGKKDVNINATMEKVEQLSMFSKGFRERRLVVPTTGFFEWDKRDPENKYKALFRLPGADVLYLAGLYGTYTLDDGSKESRFTIITTAANEGMKPIHKRMPVMLYPNELGSYLRDIDDARRIITRVQPELVIAA